ncbi:MAG: sugar nucleotide-binding protein [Candidatus Moranbacteria bacterium]|nr:sugar nucleotide-binding protein [Candidatus Moranbacteria bacterium]
MKAAIIGAGFLGEQIYKDLLSICDEIILTHHKNKKYPNSKEFDFFIDDIGKIIEGKKIDVVFLSAKIEFEEDEKKLTESMTRFLESCKKSRIVYISSDGIFEGESGSYKESDIPHPVTLYGKNLKLCEELVKKYSDNYCIARPSYMYGFVDSHLDSRFEKIKKDITEGRKISRFTDMYKSPLSYQQASEAIVKLAASEYNGTVHIRGERMSVYDFTREGMEALGLSTENLIGETMPKEKPVDFLPDTSLDNGLMRELTGVEPLGVKESFKLSMPKFIDTNALPKKYLR